MSEYTKKALNELMEDELEHLKLPEKFSSLKAFINDGKKSAEFINYMLKDSSYSIPNSNDSLYETAEMRARHSAVTFLIGIALRVVSRVMRKINFGIW